METKVVAGCKKRIIVGISGASGTIYGVRLLEMLKQTEFESHLIVSKAAEQVRNYETDITSTALKQLADVCYSVDDIAACISSGSYQTEGMIIAPCSMRSLAEIANGTTSNLLTRSADVILKERKRLVLMVRESPLHLGHIENMKRVTEIGAIIAPPVPAFYNNPQTIDDLVNHSVGRVLDLFNIDSDRVKRWKVDNQ
ncbi:UbiX family flavin prenyltransferase [Thiotrichales bacterium 19S3-7]|nr:UbiX family flavin prenyltransferase [Thiotrichales bacterium 19S3-7]MCF6801078.1 UbiX family flavin prenyltransferase [Thiotrichales bacterium 19S3-11]